MIRFSFLCALIAAILLSNNVRAQEPSNDPVAAAFGGKWTSNDFLATTPDQADAVRGGQWQLWAARGVGMAVVWAGNRIVGNSLYGSGNYHTIPFTGKYIGPIPHGGGPGPRNETIRAPYQAYQVPYGPTGTGAGSYLRYGSTTRYR